MSEGVVLLIGRSVLSQIVTRGRVRLWNEVTKGFEAVRTCNESVMKR